MVAGVQFKDNQADSGGGLYAAVDAVVTNTRFTGNQATNSAGGMAYDGKAVVVNSRFEGNKAGPGGGGAIGNAATLAKGARVINSLFAGNTATGPGTIYSGSGFTGFSAEFINITASGNGQAGVPLFFSNLSSNAIRNSIVWGNTGEIGAPIITHSLVQGGFAGTGNIEGDPHFTDAAGGNYRLGDGSPAIDAGDNSEVPADTQDVNGDSNLTEPVPDLDGHPRLYDDTGVADTGVGSAPLVDMGAFERQSSSMPPVQAIPTPVPALSPWTAVLLAGLLGWLASGWKRRLKG